MATITSLLLASTLTPLVEVALYDLKRSFAFTNGLAAQNDYIQLFNIIRNGRLLNSHLRTSGTLGASAVLTLYRNRGGVRTAITAGTTAGAASYVSGAAIGPLDVQAGDIIEAQVTGAAVGAAATVEVDLILQH